MPYSPQTLDGPIVLNWTKQEIMNKETGLILIGSSVNLLSVKENHLPRHLSYVKLRSRLGGGKGMEIDVEGGAGKECWICESKWWTGQKV